MSDLTIAIFKDLGKLFLFVLVLIVMYFVNAKKRDENNKLSKEEVAEENRQRNLRAFPSSKDPWKFWTIDMIFLIGVVLFFICIVVTLKPGFNR